MRILAVDDEKLILEGMLEELRKVFPEGELEGCTEGKEAMEYLKSITEQGEVLEYAFLDIRLRGMTGIELAKEMKEVQPDVKIIFCTAYSEYACDAYQMHALGYLLKPVAAEQITETLDVMDRSWRLAETLPTEKIRMQTFGNFEAFYEERPISFEREKAKELLAYLVDRRGAAVTTAEIAGILWEDKPNDKSTLNQAHTVISSLKKTLKQLGASELLIKTWNHLAIDVSKVKCDVYDFYNGDVRAVNAYRGEYMSNYSWAEMTNADLMDQSGY